MLLQTLNYIQIAIANWQANSRTLTGLSANCIIPIAQYNTVVPILGSLDVRPPVGQLWEVTIYTFSGPVAGCTNVITDGTTSRTLNTVAAGASFQRAVVINHNQWIRLDNLDGANPAFICVCGLAWIQ